MQPIEEITKRLGTQDAVLVRVDTVQGSVPREVGAWMAVFADTVVGTVGGGHLELQAIEEARRRLGGAPGEAVQRFPLGPSLGQCCGGVVHLRYERLGAADAATLASRLRAPAAPLALFGGGHVGKALVTVLGTLPFDVTWIDSRDEIFPGQVPDNVACEHSDPVQAAVAGLAPGSRVLIMSFSHAEDLDIVAACLRRLRERADLPYVGLIGSKTKWATFRHRLEERGFREQELAQVTCPIGIPGIAGKQPEVIAIAVAAQLLQAPLP
jgi:xanthine dehydrogenase accessory factor